MNTISELLARTAAAAQGRLTLLIVALAVFVLFAAFVGWRTPGKSSKSLGRLTSSAIFAVVGAVLGTVLLWTVGLPLVVKSALASSARDLDCIATLDGLRVQPLARRVVLRGVNVEVTSAIENVQIRVDQLSVAIGASANRVNETLTIRELSAFGGLIAIEHVGESVSQSTRDDEAAAIAIETLVLSDVTFQWTDRTRSPPDLSVEFQISQLDASNIGPAMPVRDVATIVNASGTLDGNAWSLHVDPPAGSSESVSLNAEFAAIPVRAMSYYADAPLSAVTAGNLALTVDIAMTQAEDADPDDARQPPIVVSIEASVVLDQLESVAPAGAGLQQELAYVALNRALRRAGSLGPLTIDPRIEVPAPFDPLWLAEADLGRQLTDALWQRVRAELSSRFSLPSLVTDIWR